MAISKEQFLKILKDKGVDFNRLSSTQKRQLDEIGRGIQKGSNLNNVWELLDRTKIFKGEHPGQMAAMQRKIGNDLKRRGMASEAKIEQ